MATNVGDLEATIRLRDELSARLRDVDNALAKSGSNFDAVGAKAKGFGAGMGGIEGSIGKLAGALGLAFGAGAMVSQIQNVIRLGDELTDLSARTGIGVEALQKFGRVAEQNGSSMNEFVNGVQTLVRNLATGDKSAVAAVEALGLNLAKLKASSPEDMMLELAAATAKVEDPMKRTAIETGLFDKNASKLSPVLAAMAKGFGDVGAVLDKETVAALNKANESIEKMGNQWTVFVGKFAVDFAVPALSGLDKIIVKLDEFGAAWKRMTGVGLEGGPGAVGEAIFAVLQKGLAKVTFGMKETAPAAAAVATEMDAVVEAHRKAIPVVEATAKGFTDAYVTIAQYREDALTPLTTEQKNLAVSLDATGMSIAKMAEALAVPEVALKLYLDRVTAATASNHALADSFDAVEQGLAKVQHDLTAASTAPQNKEILDRFMMSGLAGTPEAEPIVPPEHVEQLDELGAAYDQVEQKTEAVSGSTRRLKEEYLALASAIKIAVPKDFRYDEAAKAAGMSVNVHDISGGWATAALGADRGGGVLSEQAKTIGAGAWGSGVLAATVNVNAQNSLLLPSNQQQIGDIVAQAVMAQLRAQGVRVGSA